MKQYIWNEDGMATSEGAYERPPLGCSGDYCLYEEARQIEVDRDTKAANLQLLVDAVLGYKEAVDSAVGGPDDIDAYTSACAFDDLVDLARGLKQ